MRDSLFVGLQYLLPQHGLSRLAYRLTRSRTVWVKDSLIDNFMRHFRPDMSEAVQSDPLAYGSFNEFFTRALKPEARPIDADPHMLVSPVDGTVSEIGSLEGERLLQAKGIYYDLDALMSGNYGYAAKFAGGRFATLYLAPHNYHRIHMPWTATLRAAWYVPGALFSVNVTTAASVAGLFARNERVVCIFENAGFQFALVLVGALFVGSMQTVWHGEITPRLCGRATQLPLDAAPALPKGAEMGRFNMGSTVILLLPPGTAGWLPGLTAGSLVRVGQPIARP